MKLKFAMMLLAATSFAPAQAAVFELPSSLDAVTVYPQGADLVRLSSLQIPAGTHQLVLKTLPGSIDPQSVRVEGVAGGEVEIASVDIKEQVLDEGAVSGEAKAISDQIETLTHEREALDLAIADLGAQRSFLMSIADKQVTSVGTDPQKTIDASSLGELVAVVGAKLAAISKDSHFAKMQQRDIDRKIETLQVKLNAAAPDALAATQVIVNVSAAEASEATFKISYRMADASWVPFYDAKLNISKSTGSKLDLVRRAAVTQSTPESWNNVALTLSTSRPNGTTTAPVLDEEMLQVFDKNTEAANAALAESEIAPAMDVAPAPAARSVLKKAKAIQQKQAQMEMAGFQVNYRIAERVSIDNSGQSKRVRIDSETLDAKLVAEVSPRLDLNAYLMAQFTLKGAGPYLAGDVNLHLNDVYVGQGRLAQLNAGEQASLGFGADDLIKVTRNELKRLSGEEGILTSSTVEERAWDVAVKNLHDTPMTVTVVDRMPFSPREDVTVEALRDQTPPTETNYKKRRGVMAWTFDMPPATEKNLKIGYKILLPETVKIGLAE